MPSTFEIELRNVSKSFGARQVLSDLSLSFERGQTHVLLGSSGCGKSTLLRLILGLTPPDHGEVIVSGLAVTPDTQPRVAERIGYVIQEGGLFPHLTASGNLELAARARGWKRNRTAARIDELASLAGLDETTLSRFPRQLSGGQRQRIGLLRALMLNPDLLLLDEPLGALDPVVRSDLQGELKKIFNTLGKTVVIVTHDINEAAFFGHTVTLLNEGRVMQKGSFTDLVEQPAAAFVTEFLRAQRPAPEMKLLW